MTEKFGYYEESIRYLAKHRLDEDPKVEELGRGAVQRAYQEMKQEHYPGTIVQYLAMIGGRFHIEMRIKDGSIFDWPRLVAYLENEPEEAATLLRAVDNMRIAETAELYERVKNDEELCSRMHRSLLNLGYVGTIIKHGMVERPELGCTTLIKRILEYQSVKDGSSASTTNPQPPPTNQRKQTPATTRAKGNKRPAAGRVR